MLSSDLASGLARSQLAQKAGVPQSPENIHGIVSKREHQRWKPEGACLKWVFRDKEAGGGYWESGESQGEDPRSQ